jgi:hypothetical protein
VSDPPAFALGVQVGVDIVDQLAAIKVAIKVDTPGLIGDPEDDFRYFWMYVGVALERMLSDATRDEQAAFIAGAATRAPVVRVEDA